MNDFTPFIVSRHSSLDERQAALYQIYQQVLERQPYAYERKQLHHLEKDFLTDKIGVRRFLKELGHSEVYLEAFYYGYSNMKFLELCFKHFMGRAPLHQDEVSTYCNILMQEGVAKFIVALLDSEEYRKAFGCFTVPYPRNQLCYESPMAYLESTLLNQEHVSQRGRSLPTIYWHSLGLECRAGVCKHPEADEVLVPPISAEGEILQNDLLELLKVMDVVQAKKMVSTLSPQQKTALRRAIYR